MQPWQSEVVGIRRSFSADSVLLPDYIYEGYKPMTIYLHAAKLLLQILRRRLIRRGMMLFIRRVERVIPKRG